MSTACACPQCRVRRAAFGSEVPAADAYVAGINTLTAVVAIQIARLDDDALNEVIALIVAHRAEGHGCAWPTSVRASMDSRARRSPAMAETSIEWVKNPDGSQGRTWNPIRGCTRVSPGCGGPGPHGGCYAEGIAARFSGPGQPFEGIAEMRGGKGRWTGKLAFVEAKLTELLRVRKPTTWFVQLDVRPLP